MKEEPWMSEFSDVCFLICKIWGSIMCYIISSCFINIKWNQKFLRELIDHCSSFYCFVIIYPQVEWLRTTTPLLYVTILSIGNSSKAYWGTSPTPCHAKFMQSYAAGRWAGLEVYREKCHVCALVGRRGRLGPARVPGSGLSSVVVSG